MNFLSRARGNVYKAARRTAGRAYRAATRRYGAILVRNQLAELTRSNFAHITCPTTEIVARHFDSTHYLRLDIFVAYLALNECAGDGRGVSLFEKLLRNDPAQRISDQALLVVLQRGTSTEFFVPDKPHLDAQMRLGLSVAAVALALHRGECSVPVVFSRNSPVATYDSEWFRSHGFSSQEIDEIVATQQEVYKKLSILPLNRVEMSIVENSLRQLLPKNSKMHGRGDFYQTCEDLLIGGQRSTRLRFAAYEMDSVVKPTDVVLDIGCNCGFFALAVSKLVREVHAFDVSPHFIAIANAAKQYLGRKNVEFTESSFQNFAPRSSYDVIFSFAVHHWIGLPIEKYAAELQSMLKPGGLVIIESQDLSTHDHDWDDKLRSILSVGFEEVRGGTLCDDGLLARRHVLLRDIRSVS